MFVQPESPRRIVIFGLGGTIAMADHAPDAGGVVPSASPSELVAAVPGLAEQGLELELVDFRQVPGASLQLDDLAALGAAIAKALAAGAAGVVVTQGTDTLEETAFLLDLWHGGPQPVVVTGAMRNPTQAGADGAGNLLAAILTAASSESWGRGVLAVLADEVHQAKRVRKVHATALNAFQSPNGGPVGYVTEGAPHFLAPAPGVRYSVPLVTPARWPRVPLVTLALSDDGLVLDAVASSTGTVDGLVVAAFGVGHAPQRLAAPLGRLAQQLPVVLASRTGAGMGLASTYGFVGSERDLLGRGLLRAGWLGPLKARLLVQAVLAAGADRSMVQAALAVAGGYGALGEWPFEVEKEVEGLP